MKKIIFLILALCVSSFHAFSQEDNPIKRNGISKQLTIGLIYQNGYVFPTNNFVRGNNIEKEPINSYQTFGLKLSKQSTGKNAWEQLYKYPNYGIGFSFFDFHEPEAVGRPFSFYGFFEAPFVRGQKLCFNYEIGFGATFNWKSYNPLTNQYNIAIGAGESFIIDAGLNLLYNLTRQLDLKAGFSLTHFSNGALKKPNFGLNTIAPKIGVSYHFKQTPDFIKTEIPKFDPKNEWLISVFVAAKNVIFDSVDINITEKYEGVFYLISGISSVYNRQISHKSKIGLGVSMAYNGAIDAQVAVENNELETISSPFINKLQISIYPSYELVVRRVSMVLQPAFYLYRKKLENQSPVFHQRIGLKYYFYKNFYASIILHDYDFHVSDFIEWNIGYRI